MKGWWHCPFLSFFYQYKFSNKLQHYVKYHHPISSPVSIAKGSSPSWILSSSAEVPVSWTWVEISLWVTSPVWSWLSPFFPLCLKGGQDASGTSVGQCLSQSTATKMVSYIQSLRAINPYFSVYRRHHTSYSSYLCWTLVYRFRAKSKHSVRVCRLWRQFGGSLECYL